ncbi:hypothetical protein BDV38DRAFT_253073 [Aspergillus pseudotamarii]|uniref:Uncharacterized protein n=1 Tax=Aspergillus pseudotamarii TaxID=132259 RepID=A0A5N6SKE5_ASPPS|nr:uncharacterized protein BDV38DRAFT_253073 [Aspergillus pseudotamarii]KAE8135168.1 hypothetical protein BDV38DRAFT_253073 [Aspergillus pseudotamarii]
MSSLPSNLACQIAPTFSSAEKWGFIAELFWTRNYAATSSVGIGIFITLLGLFLTCSRHAVQIASPELRDWLALTAFQIARPRIKQ